jgi:hypothetical protein
LAAMMPFERGIARLDHAGGHRHERGQRTVHLVVAGFGLTRTLASPPSIVMAFAKVTDGRPNNSASCSGKVPV